MKEISQITSGKMLKSEKMTELDLLKTYLYENLGVIPRTLAQIEIRDLYEAILESERPTTTIINFPLPLPAWNGPVTELSHVIKSWAWSLDGNLFFLAELPEDMQRIRIETLTPALNRRADILGRFYLAANGRTYYLNTQTIFCRRNPSDSRPINLYEVKAGREVAKQLVSFSVVGVVRDLSRSLHLMETTNIGKTELQAKQHV